MKRLLIVFIFLVISGFFAKAQEVADTIAIEEVRITAKYIFKKEQAGQKNSRVDSVVLLDKVNLNLSDVLSENTPVYIKEHGRGALATASFRGTAPSHTQVQWNGMNINSPMLGMVDFSLIPVYIIDDLSLNHGGSSIKEQSGGLGGSININNKVDWNNRFSGRYYQGFGSFSSFDEFGQINIGNKKIQSKTRIYSNSSENDYSFINKSITERPKVENKNGNYSKIGMAQELYFRASENNYISIKTWGQIAQRSIPTVQSYEGADHANLNSQDDNTIKAVADWKHYNKKSKLYLSAGYDYQSLDYILENEINGMGKIPAIYSESTMQTIQSNLKYNYDLSDKVSFQTTFNYKHSNVNTKDSVLKTGYDVVRDDYSVFGGIYLNVFKKINLSLMLRNDINDYNFSPVIFNLGASYKPFIDKDLVIKGSFARNYHHPTLNDLYWQPGGNPDLKPEEGFSGDLGIGYLYTNDNLKVSSGLTGFYSDINNWIIWLPSFKGYWEPFNINRVKSYGIELNLKVSKNIKKTNFLIQGNFGITRSLNYGDPKVWGDESYKKQLPFIPSHSGNLLTQIKYKGFYIRHQFNNYGERFTMSSNEVNPDDNSVDVGASTESGKLGWYYPFYMNNLTLGKDYKLKKYKLGIELKVKNLFDEQYRSVLNRYMPGRYYTLLLKISFNK
ncbi:MAG: TonB-dependent receptor [Bacteroidales bacterium]|nr:TonB-dependent receptor [Bacteroidales bacterium]